MYLKAPVSHYASDLDLASVLQEICEILSFPSLSHETLQYSKRKFFVKSLKILLGGFPVIFSQLNCLNYIQYCYVKLVAIVKLLLLGA